MKDFPDTKKIFKSKQTDDINVDLLVAHIQDLMSSIILDNKLENTLPQFIYVRYNANKAWKENCDSKGIDSAKQAVLALYYIRRSILNPNTTGLGYAFKGAALDNIQHLSKLLQDSEVMSHILQAVTKSDHTGKALSCTALLLTLMFDASMVPNLLQSVVDNRESKDYKAMLSRALNARNARDIPGIAVDEKQEASFVKNKLSSILNVKVFNLIISGFSGSINNIAGLLKFLIPDVRLMRLRSNLTKNSPLVNSLQTLNPKFANIINKVLVNDTPDPLAIINSFDLTVLNLLKDVVLSQSHSFEDNDKLVLQDLIDLAQYSINTLKYVGFLLKGSPNALDDDKYEYFNLMQAVLDRIKNNFNRLQNCSDVKQFSDEGGVDSKVEKVAEISTTVKISYAAYLYKLAVIYDWNNNNCANVNNDCLTLYNKGLTLYHKGFFNNTQDEFSAFLLQEPNFESRFAYPSYFDQLPAARKIDFYYSVISLQKSNIALGRTNLEHAAKKEAQDRLMGEMQSLVNNLQANSFENIRAMAQCEELGITVKPPKDLECKYEVGLLNAELGHLNLELDLSIAAPRAVNVVATHVESAELGHVNLELGSRIVATRAVNVVATHVESKEEKLLEVKAENVQERLTTMPNAEHLIFNFISFVPNLYNFINRQSFVAQNNIKLPLVNRVPKDFVEMAWNFNNFKDDSVSGLDDCQKTQLVLYCANVLEYKDITSIVATAGIKVNDANINLLQLVCNKGYREQVRAAVQRHYFKDCSNIDFNAIDSDFSAAAAVDFIFSHANEKANLIQAGEVARIVFSQDEKHQDEKHQDEKHQDEKHQDAKHQNYLVMPNNISSLINMFDMQQYLQNPLVQEYIDNGFVNIMLHLFYKISEDLGNNRNIQEIDFEVYKQHIPNDLASMIIYFNNIKTSLSTKGFVSAVIYLDKLISKLQAKQGELEVPAAVSAAVELKVVEEQLNPVQQSNPPVLAAVEAGEPQVLSKEKDSKFGVVLQVKEPGPNKVSEEVPSIMSIVVVLTILALVILAKANILTVPIAVGLIVLAIICDTLYDNYVFKNKLKQLSNEVSSITSIVAVLTILALVILAKANILTMPIAAGLIGLAIMCDTLYDNYVLKDKLKQLSNEVSEEVSSIMSILAVFTILALVILAKANILSIPMAAGLIAGAIVVICYDKYVFKSKLESLKGFVYDRVAADEVKADHPGLVVAPSPSLLITPSQRESSHSP